MIKYFSYVLNTRKNNKNLKFNNTLEIATIQRRGSSSTSQYIAVRIGREYTNNSIINYKNVSFFLVKIKIKIII